MSQAMLLESMQSTGIRNLAAVQVFDDLARRRPPGSVVVVRLRGDMLQVALWLWWPWVLLPLSLPVFWLLTWRRVGLDLRRVRSIMRVVTVQVGYRIKRPKK